mmetsp:Transcript_106574/g.306550  ORF Transcript_106574/g.306550 Transcript_106574/m.306550 type:complete len:237 (+) Transcript_106574:99-809(+)
MSPPAVVEFDIMEARQSRAVARRRHILTKREQYARACVETPPAAPAAGAKSQSHGVARVQARTLCAKELAEAGAELLPVAPACTRSTVGPRRRKASGPPCLNVGATGSFDPHAFELRGDVAGKEHDNFSVRASPMPAGRAWPDADAQADEAAEIGFEDDAPDAQGFGRRCVAKGGEAGPQQTEDAHAEEGWELVAFDAPPDEPDADEWSILADERAVEWAAEVTWPARTTSGRKLH